MTPDEIKRLRYYEKQYLRTQDFQDEQAYHIEMRRRHLIAHHSWGIVVGLEIKQDPTSKIWAVQPGIAVDGYGREIVVFEQEELNLVAIANQLTGQSLPALLNIWIAYTIEPTNRPAAGYETCNGKDEFTRIQESFQLIYRKDLVFDDTKEVPQAFQDLPDDPKRAPWYIYLGTITWDKNPANPAQNIIAKAVPVDPVNQKGRHYVGAVASQLLVPDNKLLVRGRTSPLPTDPTQPDYNGVQVSLEGSLTAERDITGKTVRGASWSYTKNINFTTSVTTASTALQEISQYTITITTPKLSCSIVTLHIPFAGNDTADKRSRICLQFDTQTISDATKYNQGQWELNEITLTGLVQNVAEGNHTVKVLAAVEGGTLNIPHYNPDRIEKKITPEIFANFYMVGFY